MKDEDVIAALARFRLWSAFGEPRRTVTIVPECHTFWRLKVYKQRYRFEATVESYSDTFGTHATLQPVEPIVIERAEWWRLALWYACAPIRLIAKIRVALSPVSPDPNDQEPEPK